MRLLILGALGVYPERIGTFIAAGHRVWYACTELPPPAELMTGVTLLDFRGFAAAPEEAAARLVKLIDEEKIDCVYSLLCVWDGSNRATAALLHRGCPVPVVRHYKEHYMTPSDEERVCLEKSDGVIFINEESRDYFAGLYRLPARTACLDADLIPRPYLRGRLHPKLSAADGRPHLLIAGSAADDGGRYDYRELILELAARRAHVHLYGQFRRLHATGQLANTSEVEESYRRLGAGEYLHLHAPVPPARFVEEWSRYDAGLLHVPRADDPFRVLNMPNRYTAYLAAGLPVALPIGEMPAMQRHLESLGAAVVFRDLDELTARLPDPAAGAAALAAREAVTFEAAFPALTSFIRSCLR